MRLNKYLAAAGIGSRRKVEEYILSRRVKVNGEVVTDLGRTVEPGRDEVLLDEEPVIIQDKVYLVLNKPEGVITSARDEFGRPTVFDLLPPMKARVFPVGRLDADTSGLLLLTNDGDLAFKLTHPSWEVEKTYRVVVKGKIEGEAVRKLESGIWLAEGKTKPAKVRVIKAERERSVCEITITEGFNRQVRRMFAKVDLKVKHLVRRRVGPIELGELPIGKVRLLTPDEVEVLRRSVRKTPSGKKPARSRRAVLRAKRKPRPAPAVKRKDKKRKRGRK